MSVKVVYLAVCDWYDRQPGISYDKGTDILGIYAKSENAKKAISNYANDDLNIAQKLYKNPTLTTMYDGWAIKVKNGDGNSERVYKITEGEEVE